MEISLIKLLLAHLLGDFFLQPNSWVAQKDERKLKSGKLYLHVAVHACLIFLVFFNFSVWLPAMVIAISHFVIDASKLVFQKKQTKRLWFFIDQLLHILVIYYVWIVFFKANSFSFGFLQNTNYWLVIVGGLFLTSPAAVIIKVFITKFIPTSSAESLQNAGKLIGVLERLLIYVFVLTNHFEAVGFLLAAKSIFRFGDLKQGREIRLTEYVLIGTLLSFGIAIVTALSIAKIVL